MGGRLPRPSWNCRSWPPAYALKKSDSARPDAMRKAMINSRIRAPPAAAAPIAGPAATKPPTPAPTMKMIVTIFAAVVPKSALR